jgi:hypothetical protein
MCPTARRSAFLRGKLQYCHVFHDPDGLWTTGIKKVLAILVTQLGSRVFKARSCVTETSVDVHSTTVRLYSAVSTQLTTTGYGSTDIALPNLQLQQLPGSAVDVS